MYICVVLISWQLKLTIFIHGDILILVSEFLVVVILSEWWPVLITADRCRDIPGVCVCVCVFVCMCLVVYMRVCVYVCLCFRWSSKWCRNCLWPCAMVRLVTHWHAVKWAGIINFAICTIGCLYLQRIWWKMYVVGPYLNKLYSLICIAPWWETGCPKQLAVNHSRKLHSSAAS